MTGDWFIALPLLVALFAGLGIIEAVKSGTARLWFIEVTKDSEPTAYWGAVWVMGLIGLVSLVMALIVWQDPFL